MRRLYAPFAFTSRISNTQKKGLSFADYVTRHVLHRFHMSNFGCFKKDSVIPGRGLAERQLTPSFQHHRFRIFHCAHLTLRDPISRLRSRGRIRGRPSAKIFKSLPARFQRRKLATFLLPGCRRYLYRGENLLHQTFFTDLRKDQISGGGVGVVRKGEIFLIENWKSKNVIFCKRLLFEILINCDWKEKKCRICLAFFPVSINPRPGCWVCRAVGWPLPEAEVRRTSCRRRIE